MTSFTQHGNLHPFFERTVRGASVPERASIVFPNPLQKYASDRKETARDRDGPPQPLTTAKLQNGDSHSQKGYVSRGTVEAISSRLNSRLDSGHIGNSHAYGNDASNLVGSNHPTLHHQDKQREAVTTSAAMTVSESSTTARKRRKLSPADADETPAWVAQLQAHAEQSSPQLLPHIKTTTEATIAEEHGLFGMKLGENTVVELKEHYRCELQADLVSSFTERPCTPLNHESQLGVSSPASLSTPHKQNRNVTATRLTSSTSSERVLRLNGQGRLGSPGMKHDLGNPQKDEMGIYDQSHRPNRRRKHHILRIRYGRDDNILRLEIGRKINQICTTNNPSTTLPSERSTPILIQALNPMKPTHPFFTGKATEHKQPETPCGTVNAYSKNSASSAHNTEYKSFATPGKLQCQAIRSRELHQGFHNSDCPRPIRKGVMLGTIEPSLPWREFCIFPHPRDHQAKANLPLPNRLIATDVRERKLKDKLPSIDVNEDIILRSSGYLRKTGHGPNDSAVAVLGSGNVALPGRSVMTGKELRTRSEANLTDLQSHAVLIKKSASIEQTLSLFEVGASEGSPWTLKHAPKCAADVLQVGKEPAILRSWLKSLVVDSVSGMEVSKVPVVIAKDLTIKSTKLGSKLGHRKKRRKKLDEMDGFLVSSDEETLELQELSDVDELAEDGHGRSCIRGLGVGDTGNKQDKKTNTVLLSGPHGCGKTATVYAVAKELGFDIFEINPGSRRNGKDVLEKVGDMAMNHQVRRSEGSKLDGPVHSDLSTTTEFDSKEHISTEALCGGQLKKRSKHARNKDVRSHLRQKEDTVTMQRQSIILLEEVDILFEEDKQFWEGVLELAVQSKRPIILTCNDETCVPLKAMPLYAILRFQRPAIDLATDYLLLLAAVEGHLLSRTTVRNLYCSNKQDLRASIMELDFCCQMALGDQKGGMEWYLKRWPPGSDLDAHGQVFRVVSCDTLNGAPYGTNLLKDVSSSRIETDMFSDALSELLSNWNIHPAYISHQALDTSRRSTSAQDQPYTPMDAYHFLKDFEMCIDDRSATDVFSSVDLPITEIQHELLDATGPPMPESVSANFPEGYALLQADVQDDYEPFDKRIATASHVNIRNYWLGQETLFNGPVPEHEYRRESQAHLIQELISSGPRPEESLMLKRSVFSLALDPLAEDSTSPHSTLLGMQMSSFDRNLSIVAEDLAPYVRSIVAYDQALDHQRQMLTELQCDGRGNSKRIRTTRASRSALEGGQRITTRRERWFPKLLDSDLVMKTGGKDWPRQSAVNVLGNEP